MLLGRNSPHDLGVPGGIIPPGELTVEAQAQAVEGAEPAVAAPGSGAPG